MDIKGQHFVIDAFECEVNLLDQADLLKELLTKAVTDLGMEILSTYFHSFTPQGVTGVIVISTSHISIHTWPEHGYAALDLYTCGDQEIWPILRELLVKMKATHASVYEIARGADVKNHPPIFKELYLPSEAVEIEESEESEEVLNDINGNVWDKVHLKELLSGNHHVIYDGSSPFQDILLVEAKDLRLYLNEQLQFSSLDERNYHEALVFPAMESAASHERVLILGGGDGLALREVLKYQNVKQVDLVDIDPEIIELSKTNSALLAQNHRSFLDERVNVHIEDAKKYITNELQPYDVIIVDFPDPVDSIISSLYTKELFSQVASLLAEDGVLVCQSNSPDDAPRTFWSIGKTIQGAGLHTRGYNTIVPSFGLWGFHLATHKKQVDEIPAISVPHQAIEKDMNSLFKIPAAIKFEQRHAILNSVNHLTLHKLYQDEFIESIY